MRHAGACDHGASETRSSTRARASRDPRDALGWRRTPRPWPRSPLCSRSSGRLETWPSRVPCAGAPTASVCRGPPSTPMAASSITTHVQRGQRYRGRGRAGRREHHGRLRPAISSRLRSTGSARPDRPGVTNRVPGGATLHLTRDQGTPRSRQPGRDRRRAERRRGRYLRPPRRPRRADEQPDLRHGLRRRWLGPRHAPGRSAEPRAPTRQPRQGPDHRGSARRSPPAWKTDRGGSSRSRDRRSR